MKENKSERQRAISHEGGGESVRVRKDNVRERENE